MTQADQTTAEFAMRIACQVVKDYGEGDESEQALAKEGKLNKDHPAYQAALSGLTQARALASQAPQEPVAWIVRSLRWYKPTNHPCDREDALWMAMGYGGRYAIEADGAGFIVWMADDEFTFEAGESVDACKAIAERHWQQQTAALYAAPVTQPVQAEAEEIERLKAFIVAPPQHDFWGAGEPNCPPEIKAGNGELHTLRCKRCGLDSPPDDMCRAGIDISTPSRIEAATDWFAGDVDADGNELVTIRADELQKLKDEREKFIWQVRDTCARAEKAEAALKAQEDLLTIAYLKGVADGKDVSRDLLTEALDVLNKVGCVMDNECPLEDDWNAALAAISVVLAKAGERSL